MKEGLLSVLLTALFLVSTSVFGILRKSVFIDRLNE